MTGINLRVYVKHKYLPLFLHPLPTRKIRPASIKMHRRSHIQPLFLVYSMISHEPFRLLQRPELPKKMSLYILLENEGRRSLERWLLDMFNKLSFRLCKLLTTFLENLFPKRSRLFSTVFLFHLYLPRTFIICYIELIEFLPSFYSLWKFTK